MAIPATLRPVAEAPAGPAASPAMASMPAPAAPAAPADPLAGLESNPDFQGLIQSIAGLPEVAAVQQGQIPAAYAPLAAFEGGDPQSVAAIFEAEIAPRLSLEATVAPSAGALVLFNPQSTDEQAILEADAAGQLDQIATPVGAAATPNAVGPGGMPPAQGAGQPPGASARVPEQLATLRAANLTTQPPTRQPQPALGMLNDLVKRPI